MTFILTCALCVTQPAMPAGGIFESGRFQLLEERLSLEQMDVSALPLPPALTLALEREPYAGSGEGDEHSEQMGPMWIGMGIVMAVMMVGMGVYVMRHEGPVMHLQAAPLPSPAQLAVPVTMVRGGGG